MTLWPTLFAPNLKDQIQFGPRLCGLQRDMGKVLKAKVSFEPKHHTAFYVKRKMIKKLCTPVSFQVILDMVINKEKTLVKYKSSSVFYT